MVGDDLIQLIVRPDLFAAERILLGAGLEDRNPVLKTFEIVLCALAHEAHYAGGGEKRSGGNASP
jgi:hypothetical protein